LMEADSWPGAVPPTHSTTLTVWFSKFSASTSDMIQLTDITQELHRMSELKAEKDGVSDNESKVDSGVPEVPVPPDDTPEVLNKALSGLSSRYTQSWRKLVFQAVPDVLCMRYI
ncbi:hypothetical protein GOODEAATRI_002022, partial [Goodea atripinnis]